jgi:membrane-bound serine protease (ClpP class)
MLINSESALEFVSISWSVIIPAVLFTVAFFVFAIGMGIKAQTRKPTTGAEGIIGETGEALTDLNPEGRVRVHGEIWAATSGVGKLKKGTRVAVTAVKDLRITVKQAD